MYEAAGAAACSILTEPEFFGGSLDDLRQARASCSLPLLRKDFIVDEYQLVEATLAGADAALLIVAATDDELLRELIAFGHEIGLDLLVEVHDEEDAEVAVAAGAEIVGINNRNLQDARGRPRYRPAAVAGHPGGHDGGRGVGDLGSRRRAPPGGGRCRRDPGRRGPYAG